MIKKLITEKKKVICKSRFVQILDYPLKLEVWLDIWEGVEKIIGLKYEFGQER